MTVERLFNRGWHNDSPWLYPLIPVAKLFSVLARRRRSRLQSQSQGKPFSAPVVVIGNISVGGSGKTPLIISLAKALTENGLKPGVVSRGYGGNAARYPLSVTVETTASESGDEPLLIARNTGCPVVVDPDRPRAVGYLLEKFDCDVVLSDDGLQHYALHRDIEVVVVDGERGFGNQRLLPAGPLREPLSRLQEADFVVINGELRNKTVPLPGATYSMMVHAMTLNNLASGESIPVAEWAGSRDVHAVAGIGHPQRFADTLSELGFVVTLHPKNDHQLLSDKDIRFNDQKPVIITAKDAIKLTDTMPENVWVLTIEAVIQQGFTDRLLKAIKG